MPDVAEDGKSLCSSLQSDLRGKFLLGPRFGDLSKLERPFELGIFVRNPSLSYGHHPNVSEGGKPHPERPAVFLRGKKKSCLKT